MIEEQMLKKITTQSMPIQDLLKRVKDEQIEVVLYEVFGFARSIISGQTQYGLWEGAKGRFIATTPDGKRFVSAKLILPALANEAVIEALRATDTEQDVELGFRILAKPDTSARAGEGKGYVFGAIPLIEPKGDDPMARLMKNATIAPREIVGIQQLTQPERAPLAPPVPKALEASPVAQEAPKPALPVAEAKQPAPPAPKPEPVKPPVAEVPKPAVPSKK